jgi:hypothetical protein
MQGRLAVGSAPRQHESWLGSVPPIVPRILHYKSEGRAALAVSPQQPLEAGAYILYGPRGWHRCLHSLMTMQ